MSNEIAGFLHARLDEAEAEATPMQRERDPGYRQEWKP